MEQADQSLWLADQAADIPHRGYSKVLTQGVPHSEYRYDYFALIAFTVELLVVSNKDLRKRIVSSTRLFRLNPTLIDAVDSI